MSIYFSLILPLIAVFILWRWFPKQTALWEYFFPFAVCLVVIFGFKSCASNSMRNDVEYKGSLVKEARYYEEWDEWISKMCSKTVGSGKTAHTVYYDCSYRQNHPEHWEIETTQGTTLSCSKQLYSTLVSLFNNQHFVDMDRDYYLQDGNMYLTRWDGVNERSYPLAFSESYTNYIKPADQSILHFERVGDNEIKRYHLFDYPEIQKNWQQPTILGAPKNNPYFNYSDWQLRRLNGRIGPSKQCRMFILYFANVPPEAALYQQSYWQGGNKNELVVCIGVDSNNYNKVKWADVFSWSKSERLKIDLRNYLLDNGKDCLNLYDFISYSDKQINRQFKRREFVEFSYLEVEPTTGFVVLAFFLSLVVSIVTVLWVVNNNID